jgi:electron transport complex protein RnfE
MCEMKIGRIFTNGILKENPVLRILLGFCPVLAVSTSVENAIGMGAATTFVLLGSNIVISLAAKKIPSNVRIPCYIVVIATFVTIVGLVIKAFSPELDKSLGIFVPLIVVNCIILGRAEAFASKNKLFYSILDALGMGFGFTLAIFILASIREILGNGTFFGLSVMGEIPPTLLFALAPGAFITLGFMIAGVNALERKSRTGR